MERKRLSMWLVTAFLLLSSCELIEYNPAQSFSRNSPENVNEKNIARLLSSPADDTVRFVVTADSHRQYKNAIDLVKVVNSIPAIDFLILNGDITEFGLLLEMQKINEILSELKMPYVAVIGNHDFTGRGAGVYQRLFGKLNFSFVYSGIKFVCHNNNSREFNFNHLVPDLNWLKEEFRGSEGVDAYISVAHVPPYSVDFDSSLTADYIDIINGSPKTLAAFFAHDHRFDVKYPNNEPVPYFTTNAMNNRQFLLIEIIDGKLAYKNISY